MVVVVRGKLFQIWCKSSDFFAHMQVKYFFYEKILRFFCVCAIFLVPLHEFM